MPSWMCSVPKTRKCRGAVVACHAVAREARDVIVVPRQRASARPRVPARQQCRARSCRARACVRRRRPILWRQQTATARSSRGAHAHVLVIVAGDVGCGRDVNGDVARLLGRAAATTPRSRRARAARAAAAPPCLERIRRAAAPRRRAAAAQRAARRGCGSRCARGCSSASCSAASRSTSTCGARTRVRFRMSPVSRSRRSRALRRRTRAQRSAWDARERAGRPGRASPRDDLPGARARGEVLARRARVESDRSSAPDPLV